MPSFNDILYDKQLNIKTSGRDDSNANTYYYPYEPTDYRVLERLAQSGYINKKSRLIDYGCGKGRVSFFLSWQTGCKSIGIEYDNHIFIKAIENKEHYAYPYRVEFACIKAEDYIVSTDADCFYFFNPFSVDILKRVIDRIVTSFYENPRRIWLFFYYPSDEYVAHLMTETQIDFLDEIDCSDLFSGTNNRERVLIFGKDY